MDSPRKSVFDYTDYRRYLREYYAWAKENERGFSHRAFMAKIVNPLWDRFFAPTSERGAA